MTTRRRATVFTREAKATMRAMAADGHSASEIAALIGSTAGAVQVMCNRERIPLGDNCYITLMLSRRTHAALLAELSRRGQGTKRIGIIIRALLSIIAQDNLFDAVLGAPPPKPPKPPKSRSCVTCGITFPTTHTNARFCSNACRQKARRAGIGNSWEPTIVG
jgi:hypothetical protein